MLPPMALPRIVASRAEQQLGLVTRMQSLQDGISHGEFHALVRAGFLIRVWRGVYRAAGSPVTREQRLLAMVLRAGPGACAGGRESLALAGIEGFTWPRQLSVIVPAPRYVASPGFRIKTTPVDPGDITRVGRVPVLTVPRALIDVAAAVTERRLRVGFDSARRLGRTTPAELLDRATAMAHLTGARHLLGLMAAGVLIPESEGERGLQRFFAGYPGQLEWQVTDLVPGRRLDVAERPLLLGWEFDGRDHHTLPTDRDSDGWRDLDAEAAGVRVLRLTTGMLRDPARTWRGILAARERRARDLGVSLPG